MALPPSEAGADQLTVAAPGVEVAVPMVGASGTAAGGTGFEPAEAALVPIALVAVTTNV